MGPKLKVAAFLRWVKWLWAGPLAGKEIVVVNIDETPVYKQMQPRRGYVVQTGAANKTQFTAKIPLKDRRGMATVLGCIVNVPELQQYMPQFVLTKDDTMTKREKDILATVDAPIRWVKGTKGWVSAENIRPMLTAIRRAVRTRRPHAEIIVCIDCAPVHTTDSTLNHFARLGLHVLLVPGGLTWLLQPLDSHTFGPFKQKLAELQEESRGRALDGCMPAGKWIEVLCDAMRQVLVDKSWAHTFDKNGMAASWTDLRPRIKDIVLPHLPLLSRPPSQDELCMMLGTARLDFRNMVLRASLRAAAMAAIRPPSVVRRGAPLPPLRIRTPSSSGTIRAAVPVPVLAPLPPLPPPFEPEPPARLLRSGSRY